MKITEKLNTMKNTIIENASELAILNEMTSAEIADRYGYTKLLNKIQRQVFIIKSEENAGPNPEATSEAEDEAVKENPNFVFKIRSLKDKHIIILEDGFGEKEEFDLNIIKIMMKKENIDIAIGTIGEEEYIRFDILPKKISLEDRIEEIYDNREVYLEKAKEKAEQAKSIAKSTTKSLLNKAADWANKNL